MISQAVEDRMIEKVGSITDVTVHIDPEDDEDAPKCRGLPLRAEALATLEAAWNNAQVLPAQREIRLHYLGGKIEVELMLPLEGYVDGAATAVLRADLERAAREIPWFSRLRMLYG